MGPRKSAAHAVAVFIDLENTLGVPTAKSLHRFEQRLDRLVQRLPAALGDPTLTVILFGAVQTHRGALKGEPRYKPWLEDESRRLLTGAFRKYRGQVVFTKFKDADSTLKDEILARIRIRILPEHVAIMSGDTGFRSVFSDIQKKHKLTMVMAKEQMIPLWSRMAVNVISTEDLVAPIQTATG